MAFDRPSTDSDANESLEMHDKDVGALPPLPRHWEWRLQKDVFSFAGGSQPPASTFVDEARPGYVRLIQIRDYASDSHLTYVPQSPKLRLCSQNDVMIARYGSGSAGKDSLGRILRGIEGAYNVALVKTAPGDGVDQDFLYYLLQSSWFQVPLRGQSARSVQAGFSRDSIAFIPLPVPPIEEQRDITTVLRALDDKIASNRRLAAAVEEFAMAIFRSWFIDFDPVHANAEGRDPIGVPDDLIDSFPSAFRDSEIGPLPVGWETVSLRAIVDLIREPVELTESNADSPYLGLDVMPRGSTVLRTWGRRSDVSGVTMAFKTGDILFGKLRPYFKKVGVAPVDGSCTSEVLVLRPIRDSLFSVALGHLASQDFIDFCVRNSTGTRMPRAEWKTVSAYSVAMPPEEIVEACTALHLRLYDQIRGLILEEHVLGELRDLLLPGLISGRIRVSDALEGVTE